MRDTEKGESGGSQSLRPPLPDPTSAPRLDRPLRLCPTHSYIVIKRRGFLRGRYSPKPNFGRPAARSGPRVVERWWAGEGASVSQRGVATAQPGGGTLCGGRKDSGSTAMLPAVSRPQLAVPPPSRPLPWSLRLACCGLGGVSVAAALRDGSARVTRERVASPIPCTLGGGVQDPLLHSPGPARLALPHG